MASTDWKLKLLVAAGGSAAVAAALWYVLRKADSDGGRASSGKSDAAKADAKPKLEEVTKEQVQQILQEIIASQEQMKGYMKTFTDEMMNKILTLEQTYERVKEVQPADPLEKYGLSMMDFDQLLDKHQSDPKVREAIGRIMGAPNQSSCINTQIQAITVDKIKEVHSFLLQELEKLVGDFQTLPNKDSFDLKTVTIAAQAIVGAKIREKFDITSEDVESAVLLNHTQLATDQGFAEINIKIQHTMGKLMGTPFSS
jgi:hypothetical protein